MNKHQIILLVAGVLAVVLIYRLPRSVVENDQLDTVVAADSHDLSVSQQDQEKIARLKEAIEEQSDKKKTINFADSLASSYLRYQQIDSAAVYADLILTIGNGAEELEKGGMIYYRAFQMAADIDQAKAYAQKAQSVFNQLLEADPENAALKNKLAMTMMTTDNPMAGVMMLREILEQNPGNREAIFNLGLLAIRSGQYDRASGRFEKLIELNPNDMEAVFYLGVVYSELGEKQKSLDAFGRYIEYSGADPALKATAQDYMKELEKI